MKKIVVGVGFGLGLTDGNELYMWGAGPRAIDLVDKNSVVMYREFKENEKCFCGRGHKADHKKHGGFILAHCPHENDYYGYPGYLPYTSKSPPPDNVAVRVFLRCQKNVICAKCGKRAREQLTIQGHSLKYCKGCDLLQEVPDPSKIMMVPKPILSGVYDVDCGASFACVLHGPRALSILRWRKPLNGLSPLIHESLITMRMPVSSFSCGSGHIAFVTDGKLYMYGDRIEEIIGNGKYAFQPIVPRLVYGNPSDVKKVCCGGETTLCLLSDQSVWLIYKGVQKIIRSFIQQTPLALNQNFFSDIIGCVNLVDRFFLEENPESVWSVWSNSDLEDFEVFPCANDFAALFMAQKLVRGVQVGSEETGQVDMQPNNNSQPVEPTTEEGLEASEDKLPSENQYCEQNPPCNQPSHLPAPSVHKDGGSEQPDGTAQPTGLYGNTLLSDLTLKLADGEFPAHRQLLFMVSNYFRKLFTSNETTPQELDMSSYNPKAYKTLLQYFYNEKPDDVALHDLLELYSLAASYDETSISDTVSSQLKSLVDVDTVLPILAKAKAHDDKALMDKCEAVLRSPAYHEKMLSSILQEPSKFIL